MLRLLVVGSAVVLAGLAPRPPQRPVAGPGAADTVQAGDSVLDPFILRPYALLRNLTLTRGDSVKPFGRQREQFARAALDGREVLLDVLTFETPNATTVDSSWFDPRTLQPIRLRSSNTASIVRASGYHAPMWEVLATPDSGAPSARLWVSQRHRFVDQALVWEPGVSILYAR
jgi:hypothetical protein